jgi:hypothetical protein
MSTIKPADLILSATFKAIRLGRLSLDKQAPNYTRNYIYIGTDRLGWDIFENLKTRKCDI